VILAERMGTAPPGPGEVRSGGGTRGTCTFLLTGRGQYAGLTQERRSTCLRKRATSTTSGGRAQKRQPLRAKQKGGGESWGRPYKRDEKVGGRAVARSTVVRTAKRGGLRYKTILDNKEKPVPKSKPKRLGIPGANGKRLREHH